jgi:hypothetical protein
MLLLLCHLHADRLSPLLLHYSKLASSSERCRALYCSQPNLALRGTEPEHFLFGESMIVGLALVIDDISKGQRLVFRYPASDQKAAPAAGKHVSRCGVALCRSS